MSAGVEVPISAMVIAPIVLGFAAIGTAKVIGAVAYKTAEEIVDIASDFKGIELPLTEIQDPKTGFTVRLEIDATGIGFRKVSLSQLEDELRNSTADFAKKCPIR